MDYLRHAVIKPIQRRLLAVATPFTMVSYQTLSFSEQNPIFRHCGVHITYWGCILAVLQLAAVAYEVVSTIFLYPDAASAVGSNPALKSSVITVLFWAVCYLVFLGLSLYAIWRTKPKFMIPLMAIQGLTIMMSSIEFFLLLSALSNPRVHINMWIMLAICGSVAIMESYFFWLDVRIWRYLCAKRACLHALWSRHQPSWSSGGGGRDPTELNADMLADIKSAGTARA